MKAFKLSTFVLKLTIFSFILASFTLHFSKAHAKDNQMSANDKMVFQTVRLSLWYQGLSKDQSTPSQQNGAQGVQAPEELERALMRYEREKKGHFQSSK